MTIEDQSIHNVCHQLSFLRYLFNINEGLGLLKLANTVLILINPSPINVKVLPETMTTLSMHVSPAAAIEPISKATSLLEFKS